ncbi:MAG: sulfotransferase [Candidatus Dadabacteria bacterium]|nr:MAG: sulfotransferase [Candidatus Dadabacteria bacterium]
MTDTPNRSTGRHADERPVMPEGLPFRQAEELLHETASRQTGLDDFGDPSYLEGLRVVLAAYDDEARFTPSGRQLAYGYLVEFLARRLRAQKLLRDHPESQRVEIRRPIVILGLVRTGSTALHYLMGQDPQLQKVEHWLGCHPQPRPPREQWADHPDYQATVAELEAIYRADPSLKAIHFMTADLPEECRHFMAQCFTDDFFEVNASIPSYTQWYEARHLSDTYRHHRRLVQLIGLNEPEKRWLLKYPVHMKNLAALLEVYPDACIVQTHREPAKVLSSYISLISGFRSLYESDIDRDTVAREQCEVWARGAEHAIEVRRSRDPAQFFDLYFEEFVADPVGSVRRIYEYFGIDYTDETDRALRAWQQDNPAGKHGEHRYSFEGVSLEPAQINERFASYIEYFDIKTESS